MAHADPPSQDPFPSPHNDRGLDAEQNSANPTITDHGHYRSLGLFKHGHHYVFRYAPGEETQVLTDLMSMARDPQCALTMFDAAVLSHHIGTQMSQQIQDMLKP